MVSFYDRGGTIYARHNTIRLSTGIKRNGLPFKNRFKGVSEYERTCNERLAQIELDVLNGTPLEKALDNKTTDTLRAVILDYIDRAKAGSIRKRNGRPMSKRYLSGLQMAVQAYDDYAREHEIKISDVDINACSDKKQAIQLATTHFQGYQDFLVDRDYAPTTQKNYFQVIKNILGYLERNEGIRVQVNIRMEGSDKEVIIIPPPFVQTWLTKKITHNPDLEMAHFLSKVQIITMMRVSDILSLTSDHFLYENGQLWVQKITQKTGKKVKIPLPSIIEKDIAERLSKYGALIPPDFRDLAYGSQTSYLNKWYKQVTASFKELQVSKKVITMDSKRQEIVEERPFHKFVTSHVFRKTGANWYAWLGMPAEHIRMIGGWSHDSKVFDRNYMTTVPAVSMMLRVQSEILESYSDDEGSLSRLVSSQ